MPFASILSALGISMLKAELQARMRRLAAKAAFGGITLILLLLAFGFALAAGTVWLAEEFGTLNALWIVAAAALVLAVIVQIAATIVDRRATRRPPPRPRVRPAAAAAEARAASEARAAMDDLADAVDDTTPPAGSEIGSMAVIAVVGFILARQLFRR